MILFYAYAKPQRIHKINGGLQLIDIFLFAHLILWPVITDGADTKNILTKHWIIIQIYANGSSLFELK